VDIRKLELLADIAETSNLTESGNRLGYSQSGVSHTIKNLEDDIGFSLLKRTNKGVVLTADAKLLLPHIHSLIIKYNRFNETVDSIKGLQTGSLVIGTYSSVAIQWLPKIIQKFQIDYSHISLQIKEGGCQEIEEWIKNGTVDFGFLSDFPNQKSEFIPLVKDDLYAILPHNFPLKDKDSKSFPLKAFQELPFIASEAGVDYDISATLSSANIKPPIRFFCKDDHSIIAMAANGLGVTILPALIVAGYESQVLTLPLFPPAYRTLGIAMTSEKDLSAASRAFIRYTKTALGLNI